MSSRLVAASTTSTRPLRFRVFAFSREMMRLSIPWVSITESANAFSASVVVRPRAAWTAASRITSWTFFNFADLMMPSSTVFRPAGSGRSKSTWVISCSSSAGSFKRQPSRMMVWPLALAMRRASLMRRTSMGSLWSRWSWRSRSSTTWRGLSEAKTPSRSWKASRGSGHGVTRPSLTSTRPSVEDQARSLRFREVHAVAISASARASSELMMARPGYPARR